MKIRITIEYDPDWPEGADAEAALRAEECDWFDGHITIADLNIEDGDSYKIEVIP